MARMIQAIQIAYEKISNKEKVKSNWRENILKKIETLNKNLIIITKAKKSTLEKGEELSTGRKIMRELGLILSLKEDIICAISKLSENATIYQRKLEA